MLKLFDWVIAPNSKALLGDHHGLTDQHRRYSDGHSSRVMWIAMSILSSSRWHQTCSLLYGPSSQKMKTKIQNAMAWKHLKDFFNWKCALTFYCYPIFNRTNNQDIWAKEGLFYRSVDLRNVCSKKLGCKLKLWRQDISRASRFPIVLFWPRKTIVHNMSLLTWLNISQAKLLYEILQIRFNGRRFAGFFFRGWATLQQRQRIHYCSHIPSRQKLVE